MEREATTLNKDEAERVEHYIKRRDQLEQIREEKSKKQQELSK
jgi:hypothetical protein